MRIAIIGAGAIGGTMAALLARAGHDVAVTARGTQLAAIREGGIRLRGSFGSTVARVSASEVLEAPPQLAIVATKAQDAGAAIAANSALLGAIPLVIVQNGITSLNSAQHRAPTAAVVGGLAVYAASFLSPGEVFVTVGGMTLLGGEPRATATVASVIGAVMPVSTTTNFVGAQWTKLVVNHVNAMPAITGLSVQETLANRGLRLLITESMREAVRVAKAAGIRFETLQGLSDARLRAFVACPAVLGQSVPLAMRRRMGATPNPGSTLQSIRRAQPTEIDYLNGAVVELGLKIGVLTPVSAGLVELVHEVERTGRFVGPDAVLARLGLLGRLDLLGRLGLRGRLGSR